MRQPLINLRRIWPYVLLSASLWIVRYWHSAEFGLYEDDLTHLPVAAAMSTQEAVRFAFDLDRILNLFGQGHPLHYTFIYLFTNLGWRLGDLNGAYWIGYAVQAANISLLYALLVRIQGKPLGILGGLAYVLYSADTTQAYLTYSLGLHPSLTLFLLAGHAYLSGRWWLSYPLAALMLLTYETPFTVFVGFPLLSPRPRASRIRELAVHLLAMAAILGAFLIWRIAVEDDRVGGLDLGEAALVPLLHMIEGPLVSLGTYLYRPVQALTAMTGEVLLVTVAAAGVATLILYRLDLMRPQSLGPRIQRVGVEFPRNLRLWRVWKSAWQSLPEESRALLRIGLAGLVMLVLAYPLTFTVRAYAISGRDTRVHAAGVVGASIVIGSLLLFALWVAESKGGKLWLVLPLAAWVGLMAGYGFVLQGDYRLAWVYQREFWSELVQLVPDVADGTVIVVDPDGLKDTRQIGANYWNLPRVLEQLYNFPDSWGTPPRVYRLSDDWEQTIVTDELELRLNEATTFAPPSTYKTVKPGDVILIETSNGELRRSPGPIWHEGLPVWLKPVQAAGEPEYSHGFLYRYLIQTPGSGSGLEADAGDTPQGRSPKLPQWL